MTKKKKAKAVAPKHERTEAEESLVSEHQRRAEGRPQPPKISTKSQDGGIFRVETNHPDAAVAEAALLSAFGTTDQGVVDLLLSQLMNTTDKLEEISEARVNGNLALMAGIAPQDETEGMLAVQMVAVHYATMTMAARLNRVETIDQQNSAERAFIKLARTFTTQMEALNRYRGKGQQKMTVEHVHVYEGGQAVVGNVQGGGGENKTEGQPHAKATDA